MLFDENTVADYCYDPIGGSRVSAQTGIGIDLRSEDERQDKWLDELASLPRPLEYFAEDEMSEAVDSMFNPTSWSSQERLPLRKSSLIDQASSVFKENISTLQNAFGFRQIDLERIDSDDVRDGVLVTGSITFTAEVFPLGNAGMYHSYESFPLRRSRLSIPLEVREGNIYPPSRVVDAQMKQYPFSIEGLRAAMRVPEDAEPFVRRRAPKVTRSWDIPRDYRAF